MTIETKYNIGDEVWVMCNNRPIQTRVLNIITVTFGQTNFAKGVIEIGA